MAVELVRDRDLMPSHHSRHREGGVATQAANSNARSPACRSASGKNTANWPVRCRLHDVQRPGHSPLYNGSAGSDAEPDAGYHSETGRGSRPDQNGLTRKYRLKLERTCCQRTFHMSCERRFVHRFNFPAAIIHAVFPSRRGLLPSVRAFLDFLAFEYSALTRAETQEGR
jgi:hypothetical protein